MSSDRVMRTWSTSTSRTGPASLGSSSKGQAYLTKNVSMEKGLSNSMTCRMHLLIFSENSHEAARVAAAAIAAAHQGQRVTLDAPPQLINVAVQVQAGCIGKVDFTSGGMMLVDGEVVFSVKSGKRSEEVEVGPAGFLPAGHVTVT
mmetsp:Transcript_59405/g.145905  ORF Transcript_59405/g.145905 Transcript_59405/m.145905 type:complete len:146 (+) Transcript_59405:1333-1770(+)